MSLPDGNAKVDDSLLIAAILEGDVNAYSTLVLRYQGAIFNLMFRMTGSYEDSADLAQETFISAYEQLHRFQTGKKFFPWLYTIGLNHARNFLRHKKGQMVSLEDCEIGSGLDYPGQQEDEISQRSIMGNSMRRLISFRSITGKRSYCATMRGCPWKKWRRQ